MAVPGGLLAHLLSGSHLDRMKLALRHKREGYIYLTTCRYTARSSLRGLNVRTRCSSRHPDLPGSSRFRKQLSPCRASGFWYQDQSDICRNLSQPGRCQYLDQPGSYRYPDQLGLSVLGPAWQLPVSGSACQLPVSGSNWQLPGIRSSLASASIQSSLAAVGTLIRLTTAGIRISLAAGCIRASLQLPTSSIFP